MTETRQSRPRPDPLGVRTGARWVVGRARHVRIDPAALASVAERLAGGAFSVPDWNDRYHFADGTRLTANYVLALDALNFCFWGEPRWRITYRGETLDSYWALAAALKRAVEADRAILHARNWSALTRAELARILAGEGEIPLLEERLANLREAGDWLQARWDGEFANAIEAVGFRAVEVARLLATELRSFADVAIYAGERVPLLKRAQICAADLFGAFGGRGWGGFDDVGELTAFADYKLPQILRGMGVLVYAPDLAGRVDRRELIPAGSEEEVEIRAATVEAVERLTDRLQAAGGEVKPYQVDWYLWEAAQGGPETARPYHRTRTVYY